MGGDHWKSLANKLGAPGVDAPTVETAPEAATRPAPPAPEKPVAVPTPVARRHDTTQSSERPGVPEAAPSTPPVPAPAARMPEKAPKRKSSWDTLTSFFGISSAPEPPAAPPSEPSSAAPAETDALEAPSSRSPYGSRSRGYEPKARPEPTRAEPARGQERGHERSQEARAQEPKPSALDSLFGEAPREPLSWEKPAPRRLVDDVSGWDEDERAEIFEEPELEEPGVPPLRGEEAEAESEAPQRRRRRRRRGSRRDREEGAAPPAARGEGRPVGSPRGEHVEPEEWADEELEAVEPADRWEEPEALESSAEDIEGGVPERRSSRRRRRGRGRERAEEGAPEARVEREPSEARAPREPRPPREARAPRPVEGREPREVREPREPREPRPSREPRVFEDEGPVTAERSRREPRQRPPRAAEAPRRELAATTSEDLDDEVDSSLAAELEEGGPNRHPKIPTWADSLEAIIGANMDNHRRIESQRGGASRGRPRGGNGGGGAPRR